MPSSWVQPATRPCGVSSAVSRSNRWISGSTSIARVRQPSRAPSPRWKATPPITTSSARGLKSPIRWGLATKRTSPCPGASSTAPSAPSSVMARPCSASPPRSASEEVGGEIASKPARSGGPTSPRESPRTRAIRSRAMLWGKLDSNTTVMVTASFSWITARCGPASPTRRSTASRPVASTAGPLGPACGASARAATSMSWRRGLENSPSAPSSASNFTMALIFANASGAPAAPARPSLSRTRRSSGSVWASSWVQPSSQYRRHSSVNIWKAPAASPCLSRTGIRSFSSCIACRGRLALR